MKNLLYFLASLLCALGAAFGLHHWLSEYNDPGYVLIGFGHWSLETSLVFFAVAEVIGFFIFYTFFRALGWLVRMPSRMVKRSKDIKFNRSQEALIAGLVDSAEGNWEKAERVLIKHAANSGAPLLHYLTAARAAHSRGAADKRDEYLKKAASQTTETDIAVGLTQAELHMSDQQFEQALETLSKLHSIDPGHASVLKLMHQAYQHAGDWEGLSKLIPSLHKNKILMEAEVKLLEAQTYSRLLKQAAEQNDAQTIEACWTTIPEHIKSVSGFVAIYCAAMINAGANTSQIEQLLVSSLVKHWDQTLLELYGTIQSRDIDKQLQTAEQWLALHPTDPVLLRTLGRISDKCQQLEKAEQYLTKSITIDPSVAAYQLLGELLMRKGDKDKACDYLKRGLELASSEVVKHVESISE